jgi:hypothetical protein
MCKELLKCVEVGSGIAVPHDVTTSADDYTKVQSTSAE